MELCGGNSMWQSQHVTVSSDRANGWPETPLAPSIL